MFTPYTGHIAVNGVVASDGKVILPDSCIQTLAYNIDGTLNYTEITFDGITYRQTLTWDTGKTTVVSRWVAQ